MAFIKLTHPSGPTGDKLYNVDAAHDGDVIEVWFTEDGSPNSDAEYLGGGPPYGNADVGKYVNLAWKLFGPDGPPRPLSDAGPGVPDATDANPKTFEAPTPGRYLIRLTANVIEPQGSGYGPSADDSHFAAFVEIEDPNILGNVDGGGVEYAPGSTGASYIAPTEANEFDPDEGWARSAERYFSSITKQMGNRRIVTLKLQSEVFPGDVVTLQPGAYSRWRQALIGTDPGGEEVYYYNFVLDARRITIADMTTGNVLEHPIVVVLQHAAAGARVHGMVEGTLPFDTTPWAGVSPGDRVYVSAASALTNVLPSSGDPAHADRLVGHVVNTGQDSVTPPGSVFFHGTIPWLPTVVTGPLSSTDDAVVRWDGTTGDKIKDSRVILTQDDGTEDAEFRTSTDDWNVTVTTGDASGAPTATPGKVTIKAGDRISGLGAKASVVGGRSHDAQGGPVAIQGGRGETEGGVATVEGGGGWDATTGEGGDAKLIGGPGAGGDGGQVHISGGSANNGGTGGTVFIEGGLDLNTGLLNGIVRINEGANAICEIGNPAHTPVHLLKVHKGLEIINQSNTNLTIESTGNKTFINMLATIPGENSILFGSSGGTPVAGYIQYDMAAAAHASDSMKFGVWDVSIPGVANILTLDTATGARATIDGDLTVNGNGYFCGGKVRLYDSPFTGNSPVDPTSAVVDMVAYFDGDIDVTGNIDPTGVVFSQQDPATPPYDPTQGGATKGLLYTAEGSGGDANTLRYIDNQGVEIIVGQSEISSPDMDVNGIISTDRAIAAWDGDLGDKLRNTQVLVDDISGGPSLSTNSLDPDNSGNVPITRGLTVSSADGVNLGQGGPMSTGNLMLSAGAAFSTGQSLAAGGDGRVVGGNGSGAGYTPTNDDGSGGGVALEGGGAVHQFMNPGGIYINAGRHLGGLPSDGVTPNPHLADYGLSHGGPAQLSGGPGNFGGDTLIKGGSSTDLTSNQAVNGCGDGGNVRIEGGLGGLWEVDGQQDIDSTATSRGTLYAGHVQLKGGDSAESRDVNAGTNDWLLRDGGNAGSVHIAGGDAGYATGRNESTGIDITGDGQIDTQVLHGHGGDVLIASGKGDHSGNAGNVIIKTQHTHLADGVNPYADPNGNGDNFNLQGFGKAGNIEISAAGTIPDILHRTKAGEISLSAGVAGADTGAQNMIGDTAYNTSLQAGTFNPQIIDPASDAGANTYVRPGEPDWTSGGVVVAGPDHTPPWPTTTTPILGELRTPWPSIISLDPDQRGCVVIGKDHFNGLTDNPTEPGVNHPTNAQNINGSMLCNSRVPRLVVEGSAKIRGGVDPTYVSFESFTQHPMVLEHEEIFEGDDLVQMLAAYQSLRDKTLWVHTDYNGNGPTLMLGDGPIQGGAGGGDHVTNNFLVGGGNMKHLGSVLASASAYGQEGHVASGEHIHHGHIPGLVWHRLTDGNDNPIRLVVTPSVANSQMLLRYNANVSFMNAPGICSAKAMFVRRDPSNGDWHTLTPEPETWPSGSEEPSWPSAMTANLRTLNHNVSMPGEDGHAPQPFLDVMQSCFWVDKNRPDGIDQITYEVWVIAEQIAGGSIRFGQGGIPQTFEVIEILEGVESETPPEIPAYDPDEPTIGGGIPAGDTSSETPGTVTLRSDTTLTAVTSGRKGRTGDYTGIRTSGAVYTNVSRVTSDDMGEDWGGDHDGDGESDYVAVYAVSETDHVLSMDTEAYEVGLKVAIDLPTPRAEESGRTYVIKDGVGRAKLWVRAANELDPNTEGAWTIDGSAEALVNANSRGSVTVYCDGENYYVV